MQLNSQALKKKILSICLRRVPESELLDHGFLGVRQGVFLGFESAEDFDDVVRMLCADDYLRDSFSRRDLEKAVVDLIGEAKRVPDKDKPAEIDAELRSMKQKLGSQLQRHSLIVPLENLVVVKGVLKVGNVSLHIFTSSELEKWLSDYSAFWKDNKTVTEQEKKKEIDSYKGLLSRFLNHFVAGVEVVATEAAARDLAIRNVRGALSILKLYSLDEDWIEPRCFGLAGEVILRTPRIILSRDVLTRFFSIKFDQASSLRPYEVNEQHMESMRTEGFSKLDELLKRTEKTNLDRRLLTSIFWFAEAFDVPREKIESKDYTRGEHETSLLRGVESLHVADRFLKLVLSLESLLSFGRESNKTSLAEMCAFLLSDDFQDRLTIRDYVLRVYRLRSKVVHEGDLAISNTEADRLMTVVRAVILSFISRRDELGLKTIGDLKIWYEKCKLD